MSKRALIAFVLSLLLLSQTGCQTDWYCCGNAGCLYEFKKDTSVVYVGISGSANSLQTRFKDSLSYYQSLGYTWDTFYTGAPWQLEARCTRGGAQRLRGKTAIRDRIAVADHLMIYALSKLPIFSFPHPIAALVNLSTFVG